MPNNEPTSYDNFPGIDPTEPPEEVLAQFKNELRKYPVMIKGHAHLLLEHYPHTDPSSKHDEWLQIISKTADDIETLIRFVHDYLENRASLAK